jgi:hypothetical protein
MQYFLIAVYLLALSNFLISDKPRDNPNSVEDSSFDFSSASTIGLIPIYWTKVGEIRKIDEFG